MKKKYMKLVKIFLAFALVFSQLSNATVVLAEEVMDNDDMVQNTDDTTLEENTEENKEDTPSTEGESGTEEVKEENKEETPNTENPENNETPSNVEENPTEEVKPSTEENPTTEEQTPEVDTPTEEGGIGSGETDIREFTKEDLEAMMDSALNGTELDEEIVELLIFYGAPSTLETGEFNFVTTEDIMFVNELLKETPDIETEREENVNLKLELGEVPEEVEATKTFEVQVLVSNKVVEEKDETETTEENANETLEEEEVVISPDFIDGIEGLISTSDNLKLQSVEYSEFTGLFNEEGYFIGAGNEFSEDEGILLTLTFEALEEGAGEVKIDGNLYKYLTCVSFDELAFNVNVIPFTAGGLSSLSSSVGSFDKPFDTETYEYVLTVPAGTTEVTLSGTLVNPEDEVFGLETYELTDDETYIYVVAVEKDGTVTAYEIKIVRETPKEEVKEEKKEEVVVDTPVASPVAYVYSSNNYLKSLSIKDYEIKFEKGVLEYKVKVGPSVKSLDITAIAEDYRSRVEINGNENFKEGDNTVTIKVTAENGDTREYKILVEKEAKDKAVDSEEEVGKTEKIVIIGLIIFVVLGLLYLIFKKDDEGTTQNANFKEVKKDKK